MCGKEICGGINRSEYHLAKISRHEVVVCPASSPIIVYIANQSIPNIARKKDEKEDLRLELAARSQARSMGTTSVSGNPILFLILTSYIFHNALGILTFLCAKINIGGNLLLAK